ncbi:PAS domain S-box protein [Algoriphagus sp. PAP.12]|uniref:PAS domain S-box protein n=1 Tax=Algoriphagus sp. PAP.12 TaxID=2996678 RepID=UPI00227B1841|nr:PAS domain S-box protein [Algoriphagus sp. PAP.12]
MTILKKLKQPEMICFFYLVWGILWILFSDKLALRFFGDDITGLAKFQFYKGISYVVVTAILLYVLIKNLFIHVNNRNQDLELLFSNPNLGIIKFDNTGIIQQVTGNIVGISGYSPQEIIGKPFEFLVAYEFKEELEMELSKVFQSKGTGFIFKLCIQSKSKEDRCIQLFGIRSQEYRSGSSSFVAGFQDITENVRFLEKLETQNMQMREIAFAQSHLVRAPLARILGITELFEEETFLSKEEMKELTKFLKVSGNELDTALKSISKKMEGVQ